MPEMIVFEELDTPPAESLEGFAQIPVTGAGLLDAAGDLVFGFGVVPVAQANSAGEAVEDVEVIIAFAEIPSAAAYSLVMEVDECEGFGEVTLAGAATTEASLILGMGEVAVSGAAVVGLELIPVGDEPEQDVQDGLLGASAVGYVELLSVLSSMLGAAGATGTANRVANQSEGLVLRDQLRLLLEAVVTDAAAFQSVVAGDVLVTLALVDSLQLTGQAQGSVAAMAALSDLVALAEGLASVQEAETLDTAALAETLEALARALESVVSAAVFSEQALGLAVVTVLVPDTLAGADTLEGLALYQAVIDEDLAFSVSVTLDGVPYVGLSMNANNRAVTEYTAFDYNSLARFNGKLYGAGAAGLYRLEGATDAGQAIAAYARTAMRRIADGKAARVSDAYLGFRANGELQLKVTINDNTGKKVGYVYDLIRAPLGAPQPGRFKTGRGLKSVYMAFELSNVAGADFAIDVLEIRPIILDRRLP